MVFNSDGSLPAGVCGCAAENDVPEWEQRSGQEWNELPERISEEEVKQLREQYPNNSLIPANASITIGDSWQYFDFKSCVAVITIKDEYFMHSVDGGLFPDEALNRRIGMTSLTQFWCPVEIDRVLWGAETLQEGMVVNLCFGSAAMDILEEIESVFQVGHQYLCFLEENSSATLEGDNNYSMAKMFSSYVTPQGVVLPISNRLAISKYEGMYLDDFAKLLFDKAPFLQEKADLIREDYLP